MDFYQTPAYIVALAAAGWFAFIANRFGYHVVASAILGVLAALVVTAICLGLANGVSLPYSSPVRAAHARTAIIVAALIIVVPSLGAALWERRFKKPRPETAA